MKHLLQYIFIAVTAAVEIESSVGRKRSRDTQAVSAPKRNRHDWSEDIHKLCALTFSNSKSSKEHYAKVCNMFGVQNCEDYIEKELAKKLIIDGRSHLQEFKEQIDQEIQIRSDFLEYLKSLVPDGKRIDDEIERLIQSGQIMGSFDEKFDSMLTRRAEVQQLLELTSSARMAKYRYMHLDSLLTDFVSIEREKKVLESSWPVVAIKIDFFVDDILTEAKEEQFAQYEYIRTRISNGESVPAPGGFEKYASELSSTLRLRRTRGDMKRISEALHAPDSADVVCKRMIIDETLRDSFATADHALLDVLVNGVEDKLSIFKGELNRLIQGHGSVDKAKFLVEIARSHLSHDEFVELFERGLTPPLFHCLKKDNFALAKFILQFVDIDASGGRPGHLVRTSLGLANEYVNESLERYVDQFQRYQLASVAQSETAFEHSRRAHELRAKALKNIRMRDWLVEHGAKRSILNDKEIISK